MCVGETLGDVEPSLLEKLGQEGRFGDVGVGVHAHEVWGVSNPGSGFPYLFEESSIVVSSFGVEGRDVNAVVPAGPRRPGSPANPTKGDPALLPSRGREERLHLRVVGASRNCCPLDGDAYSTLH